MTDTRIAESFLTNLKVDGTSSDALRVYVMAPVWSNANGTDGRIPTTALRLLHPDGRRDDLVGELITNRLLHETDDGWEIHDFLKYQMPAAQVERAKELTRQRKRAQRERDQERELSRYVTRDVTPPVTQPVTRGLTGQDRTVDRTGTGRIEGSETQLEDGNEFALADEWLHTA